MSRAMTYDYVEDFLKQFHIALGREGQHVSLYRHKVLNYGLHFDLYMKRNKCKNVYSLPYIFLTLPVLFNRN